MSAFRWRRFAGDVILWAVRRYRRYGISYRKLEEMRREEASERTGWPSPTACLTILRFDEI